MHCLSVWVGNLLIPVGWRGWWLFFLGCVLELKAFQTPLNDKDGDGQDGPCFFFFLGGGEIYSRS